MWTRLRLGLTALLGRTRFERALADELAFHVQARAEEWERRGLSRLPPGASLLPRPNGRARSR